MNVASLSVSLRQELIARAYFLHLDLLEQTATLIKVRLIITPQLFVQVYRNDRFNTTNLALILDGRRLYARDQLGGEWHRHPASAPDQHDTSAEGRRPMMLPEFLDEVEDVLALLGLP